MKRSVSVYLLSMEPWAAAKKTVSVAVPPSPVRVPSQRPLALSVTSVTNDILCIFSYTILHWHMSLQFQPPSGDVFPRVLNEHSDFIY